MKQSIIIRFIFITFILTVASACVVSGTFAQFLTTDSGYDIAYITEWGVTVAIDGQSVDGVEQNMLYSTSDSSVGVANESMTIAPGEGGYLTFGWSGTPQTEVYIYANTICPIYTATYEEEDYLNSGLNGSWYGTDGEFYEPIMWYLFKMEEDTDISDLSSVENLIGQYGHEDITNTRNTTVADEMSITSSDFNISNVNETTEEEEEEVQDYSYYALLSTLMSMEFKYEAGTDITAKYCIAWEWPANEYDSEASANDTLLSTLSTYGKMYEGEGYLYVYYCSDESILEVGSLITEEEIAALYTLHSGSFTFGAFYFETPYLSMALTINVSQTSLNIGDAESTI